MIIPALSLTIIFGKSPVPFLDQSALVLEGLHSKKSK